MILEAQLLNVKNMLLMDTKEHLVVAWAIDGVKAVDVNYGVWAWLSIIVPTAAAGLAIFAPTPLPAIVAALVVVQYLGSALGFTARANVRDWP